MPKSFLPYLVPLLVAALIVRRSGRTRRISLNRIWIAPGIFVLMTVGALATEPVPGLAVIAVFIAAALAGGGLGYLGAHHQQLSIDPETGKISSRATAIGTLLVLGLFLFRFALKLVYPQMGTYGPAGSPVTQTANGLLIFTVAMLIVRSIAIWNRAQPLLAAHAERSISGGE